jgi:uncharacterized protein (DUF4415 family)
MNAKKPGLQRSLTSDLGLADARPVAEGDYDELPELDEAMLPRAIVRRGGRPVSANPRKLISIRLPVEVIEQWRATGPGWQTRMAERLSSVP